ncbi:unnamed protein product [Amoebophrya sp. A25]|nr:unnamed protein product [Amoebophrya sp. A25]|eukprot:GSA25T00015370001.1
MSAIAPKRAFLPLSEFKRVVRGLGLTRVSELRAWLSSPQRPALLPKYPHYAYKTHGWISYLDSMGREPRIRRVRLSPDALSSALTEAREQDLWSARSAKVKLAEVAIQWTERLFADLGFETQRLPQRLQGSLLVRQRLPSAAPLVDGSGPEDKAVADEDQAQGWRALQVRCSTYSKASRTVVLSQNHMSNNVGVLVVNHVAEEARALHLGSIKTRLTSSASRTRYCFTLRSLDGRMAFLKDIQDVLARLRPMSRSSWLAQLPGSAAALQWQSLHTQLIEKVVLPSGFEDSACLSFFNTYDFLVAGRKCVMHSGTISPKYGNCPRIGFKRTRRLNGEALFLPLGNVEDLDFLIATLYNENTTLVGLFVFPRNYLIKWGVCAHNFSGGQTSMSLYPSGWNASTHRPSRREQAQEQKQFYIDLSILGNNGNGSPPPAVLEKFRSLILADYSDISDKAPEIGLCSDEDKSMRMFCREG